MRRVFCSLLVLLVSLVAISQTVWADSEACYTDGDVNDNGIAFEISDWILLGNFVHGFVSALPVPLYRADLNADGFIDDLDVGYIRDVITGDIVPDVPILTTCNPDTVRGACDMGDTCLVLAPANCTAAGGMYAEDGVYCYCQAGGDINDNGIAFEIADWVHLMNFIHGWVSYLRVPLYEADLNADGFVDDLDAGYMWGVIDGSVVPNAPILVGCNPDIIRGGCQMDDTCLVLSPDNCAAAGGMYEEDGVYCYCYADGDINGDGTTLTVTDMVYLLRFIFYEGPPPDPLYRGDLTGDGYIDAGDYLLLDSLMTYGSGSWYPPTNCNPPNTITGGCVEGDSCLVRSAANCAACGGTYLGDGVFCACDCAGLGDLDLDGTIDPLDVTILVNFVYKGWHARELILTCPVENGDWDCSGTVTPVDVANCIKHVYKAWGTPPCDPCSE